MKIFGQIDDGFLPLCQDWIELNCQAGIVETTAKGKSVREVEPGAHRSCTVYTVGGGGGRLALPLALHHF